MKADNKIVILRVACWLLIVVLPTAAVCWFAEIHSAVIIAVALPFILVAERVFRLVVRRHETSDHQSEVEPGASPNGGPATPSDSSVASGGPPSVS
jgi:hypothetical protein